MKFVLAIAFALFLSSCQYFSYQESCEDNPDQPSCPGLNTQQGAGTTHKR